MFRYLVSTVAFVALISAHVQPASAQAERAPAKTAALTGAVVNLNTASAAEFEALPGIGAKTAARIIEYRQKNGDGFHSPTHPNNHYWRNASSYSGIP